MLFTVCVCAFKFVKLYPVSVCIQRDKPIRDTNHSGSNYRPGQLCEDEYLNDVLLCTCDPSVSFCQIPL